MISFKNIYKRISSWSIGIKLVLIISSIIFIILTSMIYLATYFFREDYELKVQEQNVKIAEVIGTNLEISLQGLTVQGRVLVRGAASRKQISNTNIAFFGLYSKDAAQLKALRQISNQVFMKKNAITLENLNTLILRYQKIFRKSFRGSTQIINVSPGLKVPMVGISFPLVEEKQSEDSIIIILCPIKVFLDSFQSENSALIQTFMVDAQGKIIMHPNTDIMQAGGDFSNMPIVAAMQKSRFRNGQIAYTEREKESYLGSFWKSSIGSFGIVSTVREDDAFAEVYSIQRRNIYLMVVAINIAILAVFWYSRRLLRPIRQLTEAAHQISKGQYKLKLKAYTEDEIGKLTHNFNLMSKGLQERENLKASFGRFVNKEIAEKSLHGSLKVGGERRQVALLFSDIRSFTSMSEKMKPEEVVKFLNNYLSKMVSCVVKNKGTIDKFIGDAIMAHWGALGKHKNPAHAAILSALQMRQALFDLNKKHHHKPINFGVGINYGPVVAGQIGSQDRLEYTVIGDTVNAASRVESLTKEFKVDILITDTAYQHVKKIFRVETLGSIKLKGKLKAIKLHAVLGLISDVQTPSTLNELRKRLGLPSPKKP